jgi:hypothetical protein
MTKHQSEPNAQPASEPDYACKVCGNAHDETGTLEHGRGCYTQDEDGGGSEYIEEADKSRHPAEPSGRHVPSVKDIDDVYTEELSEEAIADLEKLRHPAAPAWEREEVKRLRQALSKQQDEIQQILGKALGYPKYASDQKNFPGATEANGVCVGEHVAESLAEEAAARLAILEASHTALQAKLDAVAGLVEKWRAYEVEWVEGCADELAAALAE